MHCFSAFLRSARSCLVASVLPLALLGCGNAPAVAKQSAEQPDTQPRWTPRGIQAPRPVVDTLVDSLAADSLVADSSTADTGQAAGKPAAAKPKKKDPFPISAADSARWPVPGAPEPLPGAIIPEHRIVAFY